MAATTAPRARHWPNGGLPRWLLVSMAGLALASAGAYAYSTGVVGGHTTTPTYTTAPVTQGTVRVTVGATGPITNPQSVPLTFKSSGKLAEVDVAVGDHVTAGQVLAREGPTDMQAAVDQAQATLAQQQATLAKDQAGATPEQVAVAEAQVQAAQTSLAAAHMAQARRR